MAIAEVVKANDERRYVEAKTSAQRRYDGLCTALDEELEYVIGVARREHDERIRLAKAELEADLKNADSAYAVAQQTYGLRVRQELSRMQGEWLTQMHTTQTVGERPKI